MADWAGVSALLASGLLALASAICGRDLRAGPRTLDAMGLAALDRDTRERFAALPAERRRVITSHDAFGYFADAYGVTFIAPRGWTTGSEPSAKAVAAIVRQARASKASALLVENISDPRLIERIGRESGLKVGGALYSDALSPEGTEADTYVRMFEHNVRTLVDAMSLNVPAAPGDAGAAPR